MKRRKLVRAVAGIVIGVVAAVFGVTPARAADLSFNATHAHAAGAGAIAVKVTGGIIWLNRSVTITDLKLYVISGECGRFVVNGKQGSTVIDYWEDNVCPSAGGWLSFGNRTLDASNVSGGITWLEVIAHDQSHGAYTIDWASR